ncbi:MAG: hypothetical protein KAS17_11935, partial [Victivallaceae bacterium]|nr:hypothetical protein [Victivallaceae bacterium]
QIFLDEGIQEFSYAVLIDVKDNCSMFKASESFNNPLSITAEHRHKGNSPTTQSFVSIDAEHTLLTVMKKAETGNGIIIRLLETDGANENVNIKFPSVKISFNVNMNPFEIKTLILKNINNKYNLSEINMLENNLILVPRL